MKIEEYEFGKITINGKTYTDDLIIFPDYIKENWVREEGHFLKLNDLKEVFDVNPSILIIGSGNNGLMKVANEVYTQTEKSGIKIVVDNSRQACDAYNSLSEEEKKKTVFAIHLTC
ncbi:MAG: MTH938/NDUFAF3 family protein [Candidatus Woesearchaeota archaeon]